MTADEKAALTQCTIGLSDPRSIVANALYVAAAAPQYQVQQ